MALLPPSLYASPEPLTSAEAFERRLFVARETPTYPADLRRRGVTGHGRFAMLFDYETGKVRDVRVLQSTGNTILDRNTIVALKRWKAKPRSMHTLELPISFGAPPE